MNGDVPPIRNSNIVRRLLLRLITGRQLLILSELKENGNYITVTNLVQKISREKNVAQSTLRYNMRHLSLCGLITCGNGGNKGVPARLTEDGMTVLKLIGGDENG